MIRNREGSNALINQEKKTDKQYLVTHINMGGTMNK